MHQDRELVLSHSESRGDNASIGRRRPCAQRNVPRPLVRKQTLMAGEEDCSGPEFTCVDILGQWHYILLFSSSLVVALKLLEEAVHALRRRMDALSKRLLADVMSELSNLGVVSFALFLVEYNVELQEDVELFFEFTHYALFVGFVNYMLAVAFFNVQRGWVTRKWHLYDLGEPEPSLDVGEFQRHRRFREMRRRFLAYNALPPDFSYSRYLKLCYGELLLRLVEVEWRVAFTLLAWVFCSIVFLALFPQQDVPEDEPANANVPIYQASISIAYVYLAAYLVSSWKNLTIANYLQAKTPDDPEQC